MIAIETGTPTIEGRYVIYTPCDARQIREWCDAHFATWHGGKWHTARPVWGWIGPLPVVHGNDILEKLKPAQEYDL